MILNIFLIKFKTSILIYLKKFYYFLKIFFNFNIKNSKKTKNKILLKDKIKQENFLIFSPD